MVSCQDGGFIFAAVFDSNGKVSLEVDNGLVDFWFETPGTACFWKTGGVFNELVANVNIVEVRDGTRDSSMVSKVSGGVELDDEVFERRWWAPRAFHGGDIDSIHPGAEIAVVGPKVGEDDQRSTTAVSNDIIAEGTSPFVVRGSQKLVYHGLIDHPFFAPETRIHFELTVGFCELGGGGSSKMRWCKSWVDERDMCSTCVGEVFGRTER